MDTVRIVNSLEGVDWHVCKRDLAADRFDNGRSATALRLAFEHSEHVAMAWLGARVIGMARLLSDGVSNAYLVDVWTQSAHRRQGVGRAMGKQLCSAVPGQHVGLQTDQLAFYHSMGFVEQPQFMSRVVGEWLHNQANRR